MPDWKNGFNRTILVTVTAGLSILNGIAYVFFTSPSLALLGVHPDGFGLLITRYYGACAIGFGLLLWQHRGNESSRIIEGMLSAILVTLGISTIVGISGTLGGIFNRLGWLFVLTDSTLSVWAALCLITDRRR